MKYRAVLGEVVILRFGSAFSTLTVMLLERRVHDRIQDEMKELDTKRSLVAPKFEVGEKVCFRNNQGVWARAHISAICESRSSGALHVDIVVDDTLDTLKRVDGRALVALPDSLKALKNAKLYFIEGLEPFNVVVRPKHVSGRVGAQASANALNKQWKSPPPGTRLVRHTSLPCGNFGSKTRLGVATVYITQTLDLQTYITNILSDHVIIPSVPRTSHPSHSWSKDRASPMLCPFVEAEEVCEVISLRKTGVNILQVGLRLSSYLDLHLLKAMLDRRTAVPMKPISGPLTISISRDGFFMQRGLLLADGKILGMDTLESFEPGSVEIRALPFGVREALPHVGLFIDWDISLRPQTPCVGDSIIVKNLKELRGRVLHFSYEDVVFNDGPTAINYHPLKPRDDEPVPPPVIAVEENGKSETRAPLKLSSTLADWYGLDNHHSDVYKTMLLSHFDPTLETLFEQHGVKVLLAEL